MFHHIFVDPECFHQLNQTNGTIKSPNFPQSYSNNMLCIWIIQGFENISSNIVIQFGHFEIEESSNCKFDSVRIYQNDIGNNDWMPVKGNKDGFCGKHDLPPISIYTKKLLVEFRSDESKRKKGFRATYSVKPGTV